MTKLTIPAVDPLALFYMCVYGQNDNIMTAVFKDIESEILTYYSDYIAKAYIGDLGSIPQTKIFKGYHIKSDLVNLYLDQMSDNKGTARGIYNKIQAGATVCGMCFHQKPSTLDHYLPKSKFPIYSVFPSNLIPCCRDCNTHKGTYSAKEPDEELLHPYLDDNLYFKNAWIVAEVTEVPNIVLFKAYAPLVWSNTNRKRVEKHFKRYHLAELYTAQASNEIIASFHLFKSYYRDEGSEGLKSYLHKQALSRNKEFPNSWQASLYTGLSQSKWFYEIYCAN